ncbi:MAG: tetratricopeptide repeat protein [Thiobacillus sp.]|jgi:tetratricopeptide (TPR) repeat protein|uniref:tetratricopeptide repeat protein n=1 Tax=Thiobacillus sp. TaxID=924 RepID=UPI0028950CCA|nr:tetratricopeptide repeat protein [Thiobacillus sp.]MDT3707745.1 tetratricopeptide repeat protein [Thiobacillus sp.]
MALPRFLSAIVAGAMLASSLVLADEIGDIRQQFQQGDLAGALDRADRYLVQNPGNAQVRFLKGLILDDQGKPDAAIEVFTALTEDYPELPEPYNNLAVIHAAQGRYGSALNALEMAIRARPGYATAHENLGDIHAKMASVAYEEALALDSRNTTAQTKLTLMRTLLEKQAFKPAASRSLQTTPESAPSQDR